jgi:aldose sugar dehydrogenase
MMSQTLTSVVLASVAVLALSGCKETASSGEATSVAIQRSVGEFMTNTPPPFQLEKRVAINSPWAMAFMPDGRALITTRPGKLLLWRDGSAPIEVAGVPPVHFEEQGGMGDIKLAPDFATSNAIYLTYVEPVGALTRAVLAKARIDLTDPSRPTLRGLHVIWRQSEPHEQPYHFSHRIIFSPDQKSIFLTSGERNEKQPAQDVASNLGKVLKLQLDGSPALGNPFAGFGGDSGQVWSYGHRNLLGLAFADDGRLWEIEMGPSGGDELNLIEPATNYGWPLVSQGDNYDGVPIPRHETRPDLRAPQLYWAPSVNPSSLHIYHGKAMPEWHSKALVGALGGQSIMLIDLSGKQARLLYRWQLDWRVRGFAEDPSGRLWVIEDEAEGGIHLLSAGPVTAP